MTDVAVNHREILKRIHDAAARAGRPPEAVRLVAVTKTVAPERIQQAAAHGITDIGENRLQEALAKRDALGRLGLRWHFIGHLQTNKAKKVIEHFDCVQSVDRLELAQALSRHASGEKPMPVLIEVKLADEPNKSGIAEYQLSNLISAVRKLDNLELQGLMSIPPPVAEPEQSRHFFRRLRQLAEEFELPELSMGMTHDFEIAVEEGATMVRIGSGLFGERA